MMWTCLIWLAYFLSLFQSNLSATFQGSRTIYTQTSATPLCTDYIDVTFTFDNITNEVALTIFSSTNASWFGIGFPDTSLYYDPTIRKTSIMNGYAIIYINNTVLEYNIASTTDNIIDSITPQPLQNIAVDPIINSAGTITITLRRNFTTPDTANDFMFNLQKYLNCYPFLMTVAIGNQTIFDGSNSFGSSYIYIYNTELLSDTSIYHQTWNHILERPDDSFTDKDRPFNISFRMNPTTKMVNITVQDGPTPSEPTYNQRAWGLSFPDLADVAYYDSNPINMQADYAVLWASTHTGFLPGGCNQNQQHYITEVRLPMDGTTCEPLESGTDFTACYNELPNPQNIYNGFSEINDVQTYNFELPFKACGYDFNPYEYQTCRPFTLVSMAINNFVTCFVSSIEVLNTYHITQNVQLSDFPTRAPTKAPTMSPSLAPSMAPTIAPSIAPSVAPVHPTSEPTPPTDVPTLAPSATPTQRPTDLPTVNVSLLNFPPCPGLRVKHLDVLFPTTQASDEFNEIPDITYNRRRVWTNGILQIHFTDRFEDGGDWVITNNTYSAISLTDANFNNSLVYNISDPKYKFTSPHSLPGPYPSGFVYYDHFAHDNILSKPDFQATLYFACINTSYPTTTPTHAPTTALPTTTPTTGTPTMAPTANCTGFCINTIAMDNCTTNLGDFFIGCYLKKQDNHNRAQWGGVADVEGYTIFWNVLLSEWTIHGMDGYHATTPQSLTVGRYPPNTAQWRVHDENDFFADTCTIKFTYYCWRTGIPTEAPTPSPTTAIPTTAQPSGDPTLAPSLSPTLTPTLAPSLSPTLAPTGSPIKECLGFKLMNTSSTLDGMYGRSDTTDAITGRYHWYQIHGDGLIFWSSSTLHESWIINSDTVHQYWLSTTRPYLQPPLYSDWLLYLGSSPFIKNQRKLQLTCYNTISPTPVPTMSPSIAPSNAPSISPSIAPTQPPSFSPSLAPSKAPTPKPTTVSPTFDPTFEPTFVPTLDPTAEPCTFLLITDPNDLIALDMFTGVYLHNNLTGWERILPNGVYLLSTDGSTWRITNNIAGYMGIVLEISGTGIRAPFTANNWQFESDTPPKTDYTLHLDCSDTNAPTTAPTMAPSLAPSMAPTSSCMGLFFNNTAQDVSWVYNQWYSRMDDYDINSHKYWISSDGVTATIAYIHGYWYLSQKDNDVIDDEDPVMLTVASGADELLSPPSGVWLYADDIYAGDEDNVTTAVVIIDCIDSKAPSVKPSISPTPRPSLYTPPSWEDCPSFRPYFAFISSNNSGVYWPIPVVDDRHFLSVDMTHSPVDMVPGVDIDVPGLYTVKYVASDGYESITCVIEIYVIGGAGYESAYEYCKRERFYIEMQFNDTYYQLVDVDVNYGEAASGIVDGIVYDPNVDAVVDGRICYVAAQKVSNFETVDVEDVPGKSSFLGLEAVNVLWEILVLLLILVLFCLIGECVYRLYKERKEQRNGASDEQTEQLLASQHMNGNGQGDKEKVEDEDIDEEEKDEDERDTGALGHGGDIEMQERN